MWIADRDAQTATDQRVVQRVQVGRGVANFGCRNDGYAPVRAVGEVPKLAGAQQVVRIAAEVELQVEPPGKRPFERLKQRFGLNDLALREQARRKTSSSPGETD